MDSFAVSTCTLRCGTLTFNFFFFNDTATTEIYTLSLHDALPISLKLLDDDEMRTLLGHELGHVMSGHALYVTILILILNLDRKSTRLNSSHVRISYAVFCLKKKTEGDSY